MGCTSLARLISPASDCKTRSGRPVTGFIAQLDNPIARNTTRRALRNVAVRYMAAARWRWVEPDARLAQLHGACARERIQIMGGLPVPTLGSAGALNQLRNEWNQNSA